MSIITIFPWFTLALIAGSFFFFMSAARHPRFSAGWCLVTGICIAIMWQFPETFHPTSEAGARNWAIAEFALAFLIWFGLSWQEPTPPRPRKQLPTQVGSCANMATC